MKVIKSYGLIILGVLYCEANDQTRVSVFLDVIKASLKDSVNEIDEHFEQCYMTMMKLANQFITLFALLNQNMDIEDS
jgi:uncharacterized membrane-anchored protein YhcB (DUF1043 family)